jgi:drug/metabolite transporter (DMT)-like permease
VNGLLLGTAFSLYTIALVMTDVIHAILLFYLTPVWSTLGCWLILSERLSLARILSILLGFGGMALILGSGAGLPLPRNAGDWVALASGLLWSAGGVRSYARPAANIPLPVFCFAGGGLASAAVILGVAATVAPALAASRDLLAQLHWVVALALIMFVPPNFLVLWASQRIDPGRVGILLMSEVLTGAISAALLSGEPFGAREAAGTTLIIAAGLTEVLGRRA